MVIIKEIEAAATPWSAASSLMEDGEATLFFDQQVGERGFSILLQDPVCWMREEDGRFIEGPSGRVIEEPLEWMKGQHRPVSMSSELPFLGGLAGFFDFEFGWCLDDVQAPLRRGATPQVFVGVYEEAAIYDHTRKRWSVVSSDGRASDLERRLVEVGGESEWSDCKDEGGGERGLNISREQYRGRVQQAIEAIYRGEFFEVNYTERFQGMWTGDRRGLYDQLRRRAPGEYGGFVDLEDIFIASVSPEQFLEVSEKGRVVTRPIKGTRPRGQTEPEDKRLADELRGSKKDRAENVMIVDLMRNDLTRICELGTVEVTELCGLHSFSSVHHLMSTVEGQLAGGFCGLDAFMASFPAGSITGAPKLRAMEWISTHEETPRGPYTGSLFYWSDHGRLDSNVLIRTAVMVDGGEVSYGSGGAVVADSVPDDEYEEALWKARPFFESLEPR